MVQEQRDPKDVVARGEPRAEGHHDRLDPRDEHGAHQRQRGDEAAQEDALHGDGELAFAQSHGHDAEQRQSGEATERRQGGNRR